MADSSSFLVSDLIASVTELSGGRLPSRPMHGAEAIRVEGFRPIEEADSAHIAFVSNPKALKEAAASGAAVLVVPDAAEESLSKLEDFARPVVFTPNPYAWYAWASQAMEGGAFPEPESGIDLRAVIAADAEIDPSARVDAGAVIGSGAKIGPFVWIGEGAYVGAKTEIGEHTHLFPQAKVGDHCHVGRRVIINMGATIGGEGFGFAPGGAVAHGGDFRAVFLGEAEERFPGFGAGLVRSGVRVDGRVFEQFPFTVEADDFAAGAETWVHGEDVLSAEGRGKQKLAQVFGEHADGFGVGALFELVAEFGLQRGREKPPVAVQRGCAHFAPAGAVVADEEAGQKVLRLLLIAGAQGEAQEAFLFAPEHGEDAVGRGLRGGFVPREIVAVLGGVGNLFLAGNGFAPHEPFAPEEFTQAFAGGLILGEALRKDVTRPGKRRIRIRHALILEDLCLCEV